MFFKEINKYLTWTRWIIGCFFVVGLAITFFGFWLDSQFFTHLGMAFIIASIVGIFLEITEVKKFFEERLAEVLIKDDYLKSLDKDKLTTLIYETLKSIGKEINNPAYEYGDFVDNIQGDVMNNIGETYRKNFRQTIDYSILEPEEIEAILEANPNDLDGIVCIKTTTRFHLIAPTQKEDQIFQYDFSYELDLINNLEQKKHTSFKLWIDDNEIDNINFDECLKLNDKILSFKYLHDVRFSSKEDNSFTALIEFEKVEYKFDLFGRLKSNMNYLTHGANIHFSSKHELELDAEFYGISGEWDNEPNKTNNFISIDCNGWAFPQHGYFIYWQKKRAVTERG